MNTITTNGHPIAVGERAPEVALPDAHGRTFHLRDVLGVGPVIIWYASTPPNGRSDKQLIQLGTYQDRLDERGARVIVITPERATLTDDPADHIDGPYVFLSDVGGHTAAALGLTGPGGPHPAVFILDRDGVVRWRSVAQHPANEAHAARVIHALTSPGLAVPGPSRVLTPLIASAAVAVVIGFGLLAVFANDRLVDWDQPGRDAIQGITWPGFHAVMTFSTDVLGNRLVLAPITILLGAVAFHRCRQLAAVFLAALPVGLMLEFLIKAFVQRPRPTGAGGLNSSFPSGHVIAAVVFWGLLPPLVYALTRSRRMWRASVLVAAVVVIAVGASRIYLSAHWPSDSIGGVLTGAIVLLLAERVLRSRLWECAGCPLHPLRYGRRPHPAIESAHREPRRRDLGPPAGSPGRCDEPSIHPDPGPQTTTQRPAAAS